MYLTPQFSYHFYAYKNYIFMQYKKGDFSKSEYNNTYVLF